MKKGSFGFLFVLPSKYVKPVMREGSYTAFCVDTGRYERVQSFYAG